MREWRFPSMYIHAASCAVLQGRDDIRQLKGAHVLREPSSGVPVVGLHTTEDGRCTDEMNRNLWQVRSYRGKGCHCCGGPLAACMVAYTDSEALARIWMFVLTSCTFVMYGSGGWDSAAHAV